MIIIDSQIFKIGINVYLIFILRNINKRIFLADNDTISDYLNEIKKFIRKNRNKDALIKSEVTVDIEGDDIYNIIKFFR